MTTHRLPDADQADDDEALATRLRASRRLRDAPEAVIQRALGLWRSRSAPAAAVPATGAPLAAGLRRLAAVLKFDSASASPMALGLRSAGTETTRQLLYFSEGRDVDLRISPLSTPSGRQWRLSGQILGPDVTGVAELRCGPDVRTTEWSDLAEFSFGEVAAGRCTLVLRSAEWELELPSIDVPA
jgi:hypothetical protein